MALYYGCLCTRYICPYYRLSRLRIRPNSQDIRLPLPLLCPLTAPYVLGNVGRVGLPRDIGGSETGDKLKMKVWVTISLDRHDRSGWHHGYWRWQAIATPEGERMDLTSIVRYVGRGAIVKPAAYWMLGGTGGEWRLSVAVSGLTY
jgi:hypothetical protein